MAGYDHAAGMSNNAVDAYYGGRKPLSQITLDDLRGDGWHGTKKLAVALARTGFWTTDEWHHSGGTWYNKVDFYDPASLVLSWDDAAADERAAAIAAAQAPKDSSTGGQRVKGRYATFTGSQRRPRFAGYEDFTGTLKGDWITLADGSRKKASGNNIEWEIVK